MVKKLHRLTAHATIATLNLVVFENVESTKPFDEGNFVTRRYGSQNTESNRQRRGETKGHKKRKEKMWNKRKALYENEQSDPFKWFTIFGVGFYFPLYLCHSYSPFKPEREKEKNGIHHWNYHVLLTPFSKWYFHSLSVYKFDFSSVCLSSLLHTKTLDNHFTTVMMIMETATVTAEPSRKEWFYHRSSTSNKRTRSSYIETKEQARKNARAKENTKNKPKSTKTANKSL